MRPSLTAANQAGTRFTYPKGMEDSWPEQLDNGPTGNRAHDRLIASPTTYNHYAIKPPWETVYPGVTSEKTAS